MHVPLSQSRLAVLFGKRRWAVMQRSTPRRACCNARRTAASAEQPGQSCLPKQRLDRRQTTPQVAPLAARQAASHLQDGDDDVQGHDVIDACIPG